MTVLEKRQRKSKPSAHIRWMIRKDVPDVMAIERESFESPWTEQDLINCLRQRNCIGMVIESDGDVAGFMIYELHKSRLEILNFAVHPQHRNNGLGSKMLDKLFGKLGERRHTIGLQIVDSNLPAHLFFSRHGFMATEIVKQPYEFGYLADAYRFEFDSRMQPGGGAV